MVSGMDTYTEQRLRHDMDVDYSVVRAIYNRSKGYSESEGLRCAIFTEHYEKALTRLLEEVESSKDMLIYQRDEFVAHKKKGVVHPAESKSSRLVITKYNARIRKLKEMHVAITYFLTLRYDYSI